MIWKKKPTVRQCSLCLVPFHHCEVERKREVNFTLLCNTDSTTIHGFGIYLIYYREFLSYFFLVYQQKKVEIVVCIYRVKIKVIWGKENKFGLMHHNFLPACYFLAVWKVAPEVVSTLSSTPSPSLSKESLCEPMEWAWFHNNSEQPIRSMSSHLNWAPKSHSSNPPSGLEAM